MVTVRFMALTGKFKPVRTEDYPGLAEATAAVTAYATAAGYTGVKLRFEDDGSARFTARTPGGRYGRNVAIVDYTGYCEPWPSNGGEPRGEG